MKLPKTIIGIYFSEFVILCLVGLGALYYAVYPFLVGEYGYSVFYEELSTTIMGILFFYYIFILSNNILALVRKNKNQGEYIENFKNKPTPLRWLLLTLPLVLMVLSLINFYLCIVYLVLVLGYLAVYLLQNTKLPNLNQTLITIILLVATIATVYFWYKAERWSHIVQISDGWYEYQEESYHSMNFEYLVAFCKIILVWMVASVWSVFLGLRGRIK